MSERAVGSPVSPPVRPASLYEAVIFSQALGKSPFNGAPGQPAAARRSLLSSSRAALSLGGLCS
jgi:hypothetical protein